MWLSLRYMYPSVVIGQRFTYLKHLHWFSVRVKVNVGWGVEGRGGMSRLKGVNCFTPVNCYTGILLYWSLVDGPLHLYNITCMLLTTCTILPVQHYLYNITCTIIYVQHNLYNITCMIFPVQHYMYNITCTILPVQYHMVSIYPNCNVFVKSYPNSFLQMYIINFILPVYQVTCSGDLTFCRKIGQSL